MFTSIALTQKYDPDGTARTALDIGLLAEAMFYYDDVTIIANHAVFRDLLKACPPSILKECMEAGLLRIKFLDSRVAIHTRNTGTSNELHSPIFVHAPKYVWKEFGPQAISEVMGCGKKGAKRILQGFKEYVEPTLLSDDIRIGSLEDFSNGRYVKDAAAILLKQLVPEFDISENFSFGISQIGDAFHIETNLDFDVINEIYHQRVSPKHSSITPGLLLAHLQDAREDWFFSSQLEAEVATDSVRSAIYSLKFDDLVSRRAKSASEIEFFQDTVFDDSRAISEAINSGERSFADFWRVLSKGQKFKEWLRAKEPDTSLIKEYVKEVSQGSWIDKLAPKTVRWSIFSGLGVLTDAVLAPGAGAVAGATLNGTDDFIVDKLLKGWKPNQFINQVRNQFIARPNPLTILPRSANA